MSQNVAIVERLYEAWLRDGMGVVRDLMDPGIEYVNPSYAVEPGTHTGYDGFAEAVRNLHTIYPEFRVEPLEFYDAADAVAVKVRVLARGVGSDIELDSERGYVFHLLNGRIVRYAWFSKPREALEAVGLLEQA